MHYLWSTYKINLQTRLFYVTMLMLLWQSSCWLLFGNPVNRSPPIISERKKCFHYLVPVWTSKQARTYSLPSGITDSILLLTDWCSFTCEPWCKDIWLNPYNRLILRSLSALYNIRTEKHPNCIEREVIEKRNYWNSAEHSLLCLEQAKQVIELLVLFLRKYFHFWVLNCAVMTKFLIF